MSETAAISIVAGLDNRAIVAAVKAQGPRLRAFVRRRVADLTDAEDIVQDTLSELLATDRLMQPIDHVASWLFRVARNRITDGFRARARRREVPLESDDAEADSESERVLETWLISADQGPEAAYARAVMADELVAALDELPAEQRDVFVAHEIDGRSFKQLAAEMDVPINTLLGRKHAAVRYLRKRLEAIYQEFTK